MKNTLIVNIFGGQGAGKSTTMASVFAKLKNNEIDCEMCSEFAKELVWEKREETFKDELYIFAKQNHRLFRCNGKVDVIVTDRPLIMSVVYNEFYGKQTKDWNDAYNKLVIETFNGYNNLNIYLNRVKAFNPNGRNESEDQAVEFDRRFKLMLDKYKVPYCIANGNEEGANEIAAMVTLFAKKG